MPIVYVHGVAVRDHKGDAFNRTGLDLIDRMIQNITWEQIEPRLRDIVAPTLSKQPDQVNLIHAYWGDLAGRLAWDGISCHAHGNLPEETGLHLPIVQMRSRVIAELRRPINELVAQFFGDVFTYLTNRGDERAPGPIPMRVLDSLVAAHAIKMETGEPLVVISNSMGGQIVYDIITYFLPRVSRFNAIRIDYWCSVASQIGLFEEMKLFLASSPDYGLQHNNRVPFPDPNHLGAWWNVWDVDDMISYQVSDIIEGVEETAFHVGKPLLTEHVGYLHDERFYRMLADRLRARFAGATGPAHSE